MESLNNIRPKLINDKIQREEDRSLRNNVHNIPLIGQKRNLKFLEEEYKNPKIISKIKKFQEDGFTHFRSIRGDGNCFYRSCATAFIELMVQDITLLEDFKNKITGLSGIIETNLQKDMNNIIQILENFQSSVKPVSSASVEKQIICPPVESNQEKITTSSTLQTENNTQLPQNPENPQTPEKPEPAQSIPVEPPTNHEKPLRILNLIDDDDESPSSKEKTPIKSLHSIPISQQIETLITDEIQSTNYVRYLRQITAHSLKTNELFAFFIPEDQSLHKVCEIALTMGEDAEQLQMMGLLLWMGIGCQVFQLDRETGSASYRLPDETIPPKFYLLFRPGHYDLLYK